MRVAQACALAVSAGAVGGCSGSARQGTGADCTAQVRADGIVYTAYGYTERKVTRYLSAEEADCDDVGPDAAGSAFLESPRHVATWTFAGYPPTQVLGVRFDKQSFTVFVAESVTPQKREQIHKELAQPHRG